MRNTDVIRLLEEIGDLLEVKGEVRFKVNAYRTAARSIENLSEDVAELSASGRLREIPGVGSALEQKISEFVDTGRLGYLDKLRTEFPPGLVTLLEVPGLGPRRARMLFESLGVGNLSDLEQAAKERRLRDVAGFGEKVESNILRELERLKQRSTRHTLEFGLSQARLVLDHLRAAAPVARAGWAGSLRRMRDTIGDLDLVATSASPEQVTEAFVHLPRVVEVLRHGPQRAGVLLHGGLQVDLRVVPEESWGAAMQYFTGSKDHNVRTREMAVRRGWTLNEYGLFDTASGQRLAGDDEDDIYRQLGLQPIPPELREDDGEIQLAQRNALPTFVTVEDLRGDLHVHSDWTDGSAPLEAMVKGAIDLGHRYMAITDHTKSLGVTRGLDEARVLEQRKLVDTLNREVAPFRILLGTEMDILRDGRLDLPDDTLDVMDYVSVSIHSGMNQPREQMTERILRAIANPYVTTFNHPRGRLLGRREPSEVDLDRVIQEAVARGVALEVNSQPERMDLDGEWAKRAVRAGAKLTISSDAHAVGQMGSLYLGVASARRGWATAADVLNALPLEGILDHLERRKAAVRSR